MIKVCAGSSIRQLQMLMHPLHRREPVPAIEDIPVRLADADGQIERAARRTGKPVRFPVSAWRLSLDIDIQGPTEVRIRPNWFAVITSRVTSIMTSGKP